MFVECEDSISVNLRYVRRIHRRNNQVSLETDDGERIRLSEAWTKSKGP